MILNIDAIIKFSMKIKYYCYVSILIINKKYHKWKQILITNSNIPNFSVKINSKYQYKIYMTWNIKDKICSIQDLKYWTSIRNIDIEQKKYRY